MRKFLQSFKYAYHGFVYAFSTQLNFKVHVAASILACSLGYVLAISSVEWLWLALAIVGVLVAELFNTAIELIVDMISPQRSPRAGAVKDVSAAAVLIMAIFALIVAAVIFLPKLIQLCCIK